MYNPVNLDVQPSAVIKQGHYGIHLGLLLAHLSVLFSVNIGAAFMYLVPMILVQGLYFLQLRRSKFTYLQSRQWRFFNGKVQLRVANQLLDVEVQAKQVLPAIVILKYRVLNSANQSSKKWLWDVLLQSACDAEPFRQLRALLRAEYLKS